LTTPGRCDARHVTRQIAAQAIIEDGAEIIAIGNEGSNDNAQVRIWQKLPFTADGTECHPYRS
jgi:hypothetical protein